MQEVTRNALLDQYGKYAYWCNSKNGPKVERCLSKIWLYAGITEYPVVLVRRMTCSENPSGAVNQQERPIFKIGILRDYTPDTRAKRVKI